VQPSVRATFTYSGAAGVVPFVSSPVAGDLILVSAYRDDPFVVDPVVNITSSGYENNPLAASTSYTANKIAVGNETSVTVTVNQAGSIHVVIAFIQDTNSTGFDRSVVFGVPGGLIPDMGTVFGGEAVLYIADSEDPAHYDTTRRFYYTGTWTKPTAWPAGGTWNEDFWYVETDITRSIAGTKKYIKSLMLGPKAVAARIGGTEIFNSGAVVGGFTQENQDWWCWDSEDPVLVGEGAKLRLLKMSAADLPYQLSTRML